MSNILNHNRLPLECKLSYKDYWDFCLRIGREYYGFSTGMQTDCLSAFIDTTFDECIGENNSLVSIGDYTYDDCASNGVILENFGLTGMDNGYILFDKDEITEEEFNNLLQSQYALPEGDCTLHVFPVSGNNKIYSYSNEIVNFGNIRVAKLNGGFYQGFFRTGDGCDYSILPSDIKNGLSLEFELYRKDFENDGDTLNNANESCKGIFFYIGARAENKWIRYYVDKCSENDSKPETTDMETSDGIQLDDYVPELTESNNKFLIYSRTCGGTTVLNDTGEETVLVESSPVEYEDNLFTVFSRKCGGITVKNFEEDYLKEHPTNKYNIYSDLWNNALAFQIKDDGSVGYKYLVKNCESDKPECSYKIESEFSHEHNVPYGEWVTIHVRIVPSGANNMRLLFYVDGRLVLYSKELQKLNLRELNDLYEKQEGVPFNISIGGGTQGLADVVYEDYMTYHETHYPLQENFGGSFVGYLKSFKFYSCSLNYSQINQNVIMTKPEESVNAADFYILFMNLHYSNGVYFVKLDGVDVEYDSLTSEQLLSMALKEDGQVDTNGYTVKNEYKKETLTIYGGTSVKCDYIIRSSAIPQDTNTVLIMYKTSGNSIPLLDKFVWVSSLSNGYYYNINTNTDLLKPYLQKQNIEIDGCLYSVKGWYAQTVGTFDSDFGINFYKN